MASSRRRLSRHPIDQPSVSMIVEWARLWVYRVSHCPTFLVNSLWIIGVCYKGMLVSVGQSHDFSLWSILLLGNRSINVEMIYKLRVFDINWCLITLIIYVQTLKRLLGIQRCFFNTRSAERFRAILVAILTDDVIWSVYKGKCSWIRIWVTDHYGGDIPGFENIFFWVKILPFCGDIPLNAALYCILSNWLRSITIDCNWWFFWKANDTAKFKKRQVFKLLRASELNKLSIAIDNKWFATWHRRIWSI